VACPTTAAAGPAPLAGDLAGKNAAAGVSFFSAFSGAVETYNFVPSAENVMLRLESRKLCAS
jgi:ethanolamine utilization microcompartment shell protein EutS